LLSKWDHRFLRLAEYWAKECSKDPSTQVGAILAVDKQLISMGFNGFPPSVPDKEEWLNDRDEKYPRMIHAEKNCLTFSERNDIVGATLYVAPIPPCHACALDIILARDKRGGPVRVVTLKSHFDHSRMGDSFKAAARDLRRSGITIEYAEEVDPYG
jgi:dCMP deaminase